MDFKRIAKDTTKVTISYLTYQAVKTVINQLNETNKPLGFWLHEFSTKEKIQDGEAYLLALLKEHQELAFRVMTVRGHLAEEVAEFLPEMICTGIQQANIEHRRRHLEHIAQLQVDDPATSREPDPDSDIASSDTASSE